jgi:hypothetical protein
LKYAAVSASHFIFLIKGDENMMKKTFITLLVMVFVMLSCGLAQAVPTTIATFADPAVNGSKPLFTVNLAGDLITGGWADSNTGLTLQIPYSGNIYHNAFFTMTDIAYTDDTSTITGGGTIKFFADGQSTSTTPLIQISFVAGHVSLYGFGAMNTFSPDGVTITGSEIVGSLTDDASFAFGFGNQSLILPQGFTATGSFTSSAEAPEPVTLLLLGTASIFIFTRKKGAA